MTTATTQLERAAHIVKHGGVVIVPTETFYALAADPFRVTALQRIYEIKGRPDFKPLPLIACDKETVLAAVVEPGPLSHNLMETFWPGSLTILLKPAFSGNPFIAGPSGKIGIRVPPDCAARTLARLAGGWITATSANLSGDPNPREVSMIAGAVVRAVDMVLDLGPTPGGLPSTVVEPVGCSFRIVRAGAVPEDVVRKHVEDCYTCLETTTHD
ncbi:MAG: L-threonylcarbamoyladenylate synthase [Thermodesulfobacteriota bacterium]